MAKFGIAVTLMEDGSRTVTTRLSNPEGGAVVVRRGIKIEDVGKVAGESAEIARLPRAERIAALNQVPSDWAG